MVWSGKSKIFPFALLHTLWRHFCWCYMYCVLHITGRRYESHRFKKNGNTVIRKRSYCLFWHFCKTFSTSLSLRWLMDYILCLCKWLAVTKLGTLRWQIPVRGTSPSRKSQRQWFGILNWHSSYKRKRVGEANYNICSAFSILSNIWWASYF